MDRNLKNALALGMITLIGTANAAHAQKYVFDRNIGVHGSGPYGSGNGNGQFNYPRDVALDKSGNIFVADDNSRISEFNSNGGFIKTIGSYGNGNGQLYYPYGVTLDASGNVFVSDTYNNRIEGFNSSGDFIVTFGSLGSGNGQFSFPRGVALDASGNIFGKSSDLCE